MSVGDAWCVSVSYSVSDFTVHFWLGSEIAWKLMAENP